MTSVQPSRAIRSISLSLLLVLSVTVGTVALSGTASAAANSADVVADDHVASPDETINVDITLDSADPNTVAFRIVDSEGNQEFVTDTKSDGATSFEAEIPSGELASLSEGEVTIHVDHRDGYVESEANDTFILDDTAPEPAEIDSISEPTESPNITGTATDDNLDTVHIAIRDSNDDYYDSDGSTSGSKQWISTTVEGDRWYYNTTSLPDDGDYDVFLNASDEADNNASYFDGPDNADLMEEFALDSSAPSFDSGPSVTDETDGDGEVQVGDTVSVSTDVSDSTSGVESVTVNASALTGDSSLSMDATSTAGSTTTYETEFTVSNPTVSDGSHDLNVTAEDINGNTDTASDSIDLVTDVGSVDELTVQQDFIGIVEDSNESVRVTADGVADPRGNTVEDKENVPLSVGDHSYEVDVNSGSVDAEINPEDISNTHSTGEATVELAGGGDESVELVHEAYGLNESYQTRGTPMDAEDVSFQYVDDTLAYNTSNDSWESPDSERAGSAYYVSGINDSARIGYTFSENSEDRTRHLVEGYNLVAATPDLNDGQVNLADELGSISFDRDDVFFADPNNNLSDPEEQVVASEFRTANDPETLSNYGAFYVFVEPGEDDEWGVITSEDYDPSEGS